MDISIIAAQPRTIEILHPASNQPTGLKITLLPPGDDKVEAARRKQMNRRMNSRNTKMTAEQIEAENMEILLVYVGGWEWTGTASFQGEKLEHNPDNVRRVLKSARWIRDQISGELEHAADFYEA